MDIEKSTNSKQTNQLNLDKIKSKVEHMLIINTLNTNNLAFKQQSTSNPPASTTPTDVPTPGDIDGNLAY